MCGQQTDDGVTVCAACSAAQQPAPAPAPAAAVVDGVVSAPLPQKKSKLPIVILSACAVALVAIAIVVIGWLTNWFGTVSPLQDLLDAVPETLSAKNLTLHIEIDEGSNKAYSHDVRIVLDKPGRNLSFYVENQDDDYFSIYALHDFTIYDYSERGTYKYGSSESIDEDLLDDLFDELETLNSDDMDWGELFESAGWNNYDEYIREEQIPVFLKFFYKNCLCEDEWLEEFLGFSQDGDTYFFAVDVKKLGKELINLVLDSDLLTSDGKKIVKQLKQELNSVNIDIELAVALDGDYLAMADLELSSGRQTFSFLGEISNVNKTVITNEEIDALAKKIDDLKVRCKGCNQLVIPYQDGYCDDCYDDLFGYCDWCNDYARLVYETYNGYRMCSDCYNYYY